MVDIDEQLAAQIHGAFNFDSDDSDSSDGGKSEFDEELEAHRPPPVSLADRQEDIVKIEAFKVVCYKKRDARNYKKVNGVAGMYKNEGAKQNARNIHNYNNNKSGIKSNTRDLKTAKPLHNKKNTNSELLRIKTSIEIGKCVGKQMTKRKRKNKMVASSNSSLLTSDMSSDNQQGAQNKINDNTLSDKSREFHDSCLNLDPNKNLKRKVRKRNKKQLVLQQSSNTPNAVPKSNCEVNNEDWFNQVMSQSEKQVSINIKKSLYSLNGVRSFWQSEFDKIVDDESLWSSTNPEDLLPMFQSVNNRNTSNHDWFFIVNTASVVSEEVDEPSTIKDSEQASTTNTDGDAANSSFIKMAEKQGQQNKNSHKNSQLNVYSNFELNCNESLTTSIFTA